MQQQLWADTYSADNMQALAAISRELQEEEQELCQHIEQVRTCSCSCRRAGNRTRTF
jgi:hypothetical protein